MRRYYAQKPGPGKGANRNASRAHLITMAPAGGSTALLPAFPSIASAACARGDVNFDGAVAPFGTVSGSRCDAAHRCVREAITQPCLKHGQRLAVHIGNAARQAPAF